MATLLRTNNTAVATKKIAGTFCPLANPPANLKVKTHLPTSDVSSYLSTTTSLQTLTTKHVNGLISPKGFLTSTKAIAVNPFRCFHSDVQFPNFDSYRHDVTLDVNTPARETEDDRRAFPNAVFYGVGGMITLLSIKEIGQKMVYYKGMAADQRALASIEVNLNDIPMGKTVTYEWRGKPVFVRHRTEEEVQKEREVDVASLRHPEADEDRVKKDEWSVLIGICTHLGCVPIIGAGDYGGYFCPCHGSHYDASGRIRKGPAPLNLNVPEYTFKSDSVIEVGTS